MFQREGSSSIRHLFSALALCLAITAIYGSIAWGMCESSPTFKAHLFLAGRFLGSRQPPTPHFLFHYLVELLVAKHLVSTLVAAGRAVLMGCYVLVSLETYAMLWSIFRNTRVGRPWILFLSGFAALVAQPITNSHAYALGFLWPEAYEVPTSILLKPFALASFAFTAWYVSRRRNFNAGMVGLFAVSTVAGSLSKPNFVICIVPAAALLVTYRVARRLPVSVRELLGGLFLPAVVVLGWQYYVTYSAYAPGKVMYHDSIVWAPLKFMAAVSPTGMFLKLLLSILFPLVVTVLNWKLVWRDTMMVLAWLCFLFGAIDTYALSEKLYWSAGNMVWSGYITTFTLFVASVIFWLRRVDTYESSRSVFKIAMFCGACLMLHVLSGMRLDWLYLTHIGCVTDFHLANFVCAK